LNYRSVVETWKLLQSFEELVASLGLTRHHAATVAADKDPEQVIHCGAIRRCFNQYRAQV